MEQHGPFLILSRASILGGLKMIASSAYWKWDTIMPFSFKEIPSHSFIFAPFISSKFNVSITRLNKIGERGSPCRWPLCSLNGGMGEPLSKIKAEAGITHAQIHWHHWRGNPIRCKVQLRNPHDTQSKALWKSNLNVTTLNFFRLHVPIISFATRATSNTYLPWMKAY